MSHTAWPFIEAQRLHKLYSNGCQPPKGYILFATGYGPSGLPHIGTFAEVLRTTMIRHAYQNISSIPTRLYSFSDDMDALRRVPQNVPQQDMLAKHLGKPLTSIPDPYGTHKSFGDHNNAMLKRFLASFQFDYQFQSATENYQKGLYDKTLLAILAQHETICAIVRPTLRQERRQTYSPFLPLCPETHVVLQAAVIKTDSTAGTIVYKHPISQKTIETPVTGGKCKLQWKADWAMRWAAMDVDYEIAGKDLSESFALSARIANCLGKTPPLGFIYELFLDEQGEKISKSKGNGITIDAWLESAPKESLAYFMYQHPKRAKRLSQSDIPKYVDAYLTQLHAFPQQDTAQQCDNPVWHIHQGHPPQTKSHFDFTMMVNLAAASNARDEQTLLAFMQKFDSTNVIDTDPLLATLISKAIAYAQNNLQKKSKPRPPNASERKALLQLKAKLQETNPKQQKDVLTQTLQQHFYETAKDNAIPMKRWFESLYQILLGQNTGPRMGSFVAIYGIDASLKLIDQALKRS